jgi:hypothetical protein
VEPGKLLPPTNIKQFPFQNHLLFLAPAKDQILLNTVESHKTAPESCQTAPETIQSFTHWNLFGAQEDRSLTSYPKHPGL